MTAADPRALVTSLSVFATAATEWEAWPLTPPGRVVMHARCGTTTLAVHMDRAGITRLQGALGEALVVLETSISPA